MHSVVSPGGVVGGTSCRGASSRRGRRHGHLSLAPAAVRRITENLDVDSNRRPLLSFVSPVAYLRPVLARELLGEFSKQSCTCLPRTRSQAPNGSTRHRSRAQNAQSQIL